VGDGARGEGRGGDLGADHTADGAHDVVDAISYAGALGWHDIGDEDRESGDYQSGAGADEGVEDHVLPGLSVCQGEQRGAGRRERESGGRGPARAQPGGGWADQRACG